jgi:hypothetical protein
MWSCPCAYLIKYYAMKAYGGVDVYIHIFLTSALAGGEWLASCADRFTPGERAPGTLWIRGRVDPRAGLDEVEKKKFFTLPRLELWPLSRPAGSQSLCRLGYPSSSLSFFFYLDYETIGTAATPGLLCQPRVIKKMIVESMMECRLARETEVLGENLPQRHFCPSQNPTCPPAFEPGPPRWEAGD